MRRNDILALRQIFEFRCGYCRVSEIDVGSELTIDHFVPRASGGSDEIENWVYCCHRCNEFKGNFWAPDSPQRILHPVRDRIADHIREREDSVLLGISDTGAFHIEKLRLNRAPLLANRRERNLLVLEREAQTVLLQRLEELDEEIQGLLDKLQRLQR